jgi:DivIVA domain-containing protein
VADFILTVLAALVVGGIGFGLFSFVAGRDPGLAEPVPDGAGDDPLSEVPAELADGPLTAGGLEASRFDVVIRGYRMDQVDALMARAARTIRELEGQLAGVADPRPAADERAGADPVDELADARTAAETAADPAR